MIIEKIDNNIKDIEIKDKKEEAILVCREELNKTHRKFKTETGETFAVSLCEGEHLDVGAVLFEDDERVVYLALKPEECLEIKPRTREEWVLAAFNSGNMHCDAYIGEDCILTHYNYVLERQLKKLGIPVEKKLCKMEGIPAKASPHKE